VNIGLPGRNFTIFPYLWHKGLTHLKKRRLCGKIEIRLKNFGQQKNAELKKLQFKL